MQIGERLMTQWVVGASLGVVSLVVALCTPGWSQNQPLSFGVIIWRSPTLTAQFWNPILRDVSERSGVPLQLKVAQTGPEHTAMVRRGDYHFLFSNHNFIKDNEESGYRVFARPKEDAGEAFLKMADDPEGARVLAASADVRKQAQPLRLIASKDSEFDNMRKFYRTTLVKVELQ
jgi:hypothetical protein